jgi:hypothetical protein
MWWLAVEGRFRPANIPAARPDARRPPLPSPRSPQLELHVLLSLLQSSAALGCRLLVPLLARSLPAMLPARARAPLSMLSRLAALTHGWSCKCCRLLERGTELLGKMRS